MGSERVADGVPLEEEDIAYAAREQLQWMNAGQNSDVSSNWELAYRYYHNESRVEDQEGRSKLQSSDVSDAVEWILPVVIKAFVESPDVVRFDALHEEDEDQARLETAYVHQKFIKEGGGFQTLYETIKDAALLKVGVTNCYWDHAQRRVPQEYSELTAEELGLLLYPADGTEVVDEEREISHIPATDPQTGGPLIDPGTEEPITIPVFSGKIRRITARGQPAIEVCKPERFKVNMDHDSIDLSRARACSYSSEKTAAELVALGYDPEVVDEVPEAGSARGGPQNAMVQAARETVENTYSNPGVSSQAQESVDRSQRVVTLNRVFLSLDVNGDGYEEYVLVVLGGEDGEVFLDWYEVEDNPFNAATLFLSPHKFFGVSVFDKLKTLQDGSTAFLRMAADNIGLINDPPRKYVPGVVNWDDVMVRRMGGQYRTTDMNAYAEMPPAPSFQAAFQMLDYFEKKRGDRVGVDPNSQSIANVFPDESMNTSFERLMSAKEEVVGLMIRLVAEVWFKPLMLKLRKLIMTHQTRAETVRIGKKWVQMDPREWFDRAGATVKVGLGTGDRIKKLAALREVIGMQAQAVNEGLDGYLVTNSKRYAAAADFVRYSGLGDPDEYWLNPQKTEAEILAATQGQQPPSADALEAYAARERAAAAAAPAAAPAATPAAIDPQVALALEQMKTQNQQEIAQMKMQVEQMKLMVNQQQFEAKERREWATLAADSEQEAASLAIEASKAQGVEG